MKKDRKKSRGKFKPYAVFCVALCMLPLLYAVSIGPMTPLLTYHGGDRGRQLWNTMYGDPLGKLPLRGRQWVNKYMSFSDRLYWKVRNWMEE